MQTKSNSRLSLRKWMRRIAPLACAAALSFVVTGSAAGQTPTTDGDLCAAPKKNWDVYVNRDYGFCFQYPKIYKRVPLPAPNARSLRRPYEHNLFHLKRPAMDAKILVIFNDQPFDLQNLVQIAAPTGNTFPPEAVLVGTNTFYRYGAGGGGAEYPDVYFYNLNGRTLEIYFSGPYLDGRHVSDETKKLEAEILATFRTR
jgi:hypothetical protein